MALLPLAFQDQQQAEPLFYSQPTHEVHLLLQQLEMKGCFSFFFQEVWLEASLEYLPEGLVDFGFASFFCLLFKNPAQNWQNCGFCFSRTCWSYYESVFAFSYKGRSSLLRRCRSFYSQLPRNILHSF